MVRDVHMTVDPGRQKPPVFIVGCPRSGTSLLRDLLNSHPHIKIPGETTVLISFYEAFGNELSEAARKEVRWLWTHTKQFGRLGIDLPDESIRGEPSLSGIFGHAFQRFAERHGAARWGEKTPEYALGMPQLHRMWPGAKFIHVIRDGRDVALSLKNVSFVAPKDTYVIAQFWQDMIEACRQGAQGLPPESFMELQFEDLLACPKTKIQDVLAFLGEPYHDACLVPTRTFSAYDPEKRHDVTDKRINRGNAHKWKDGMSRDDLAVFEGVAGEMLASLGYASAGAQPRRPGWVEAWVRRTKDVLQRAYMRMKYNRDNPLDVLTLYVYVHLKVRKHLREMVHHHRHQDAGTSSTGCSG